MINLTMHLINSFITPPETTCCHFMTSGKGVDSPRWHSDLVHVPMEVLLDQMFTEESLIIGLGR